MKIVVSTHLTSEFPSEWSAFTDRYPAHDFVDAGEDGVQPEMLADTSILVSGDVDANTLETAPDLQWLFIPYTGVNRLPFDELIARGVRVSNNHGNGPIVAERAFSLALALLGRIREFDVDLREGRWHRTGDPEKPFEYWTSLRGMPVTMLGCGRISREIAALLKPFGCRITGFRRDPAKAPLAGFDAVTADLGEALDAGTLVFITLPLTPDTRGLVGAEELSRMRGKYLVNVSRGPVVDEGSLYAALKDETLAGAAVDAWYAYPKPWFSERLPGHFPFEDLANLVMSPHAGSHTPEGKYGQFAELLENLGAVLDGRDPPDEVDAAHGY